MEDCIKIDLDGRYLHLQDQGIDVFLLSKDGYVTFPIFKGSSMVLLPEYVERFFISIIYRNEDLGYVKGKVGGVLRRYAKDCWGDDVLEFIEVFRKEHKIRKASYKGFLGVTRCQPYDGVVKIVAKQPGLEENFCMTPAEQDDIIDIMLQKNTKDALQWFRRKIKEKGLCNNDKKFKEASYILMEDFFYQYGTTPKDLRKYEYTRPIIDLDELKLDAKFYSALILVFMIPLSIGISMIYGALWIIENTKPGIFGLAMIPVLLLGGLAVLGYLGEAIKRLGK